jgi:DNA polymerase-3 subunit delta
MPPKAADRLLADVQRTDTEALRRALETMADLELASRGGADGGLGEDTLAVSALRRLAA